MVTNLIYLTFTLHLSIICSFVSWHSLHCYDQPAGLGVCIIPGDSIITIIDHLFKNQIGKSPLLI